ncbi:hypothetical protein [Massilia sp.]|uniref:hypothetical protein n=1 Tax=Massilia sp. TaxID=1882437 RepID=UPI00352E21C8
MAEIQHYFKAQIVDHTGDGTLTDGSVVWEVVNPDGERVASCSNEDAARKLEVDLNLLLTDWVEEDESDRVVND